MRKREGGKGERVGKEDLPYLSEYKSHRAISRTPKIGSGFSISLILYIRDSRVTFAPAPANVASLQLAQIVVRYVVEMLAPSSASSSHAQVSRSLLRTPSPHCDCQ